MHDPVSPVSPVSKTRWFRWARRFVDAISWIVPSSLRDEWREAWLGELWHRALRRPSKRGSPRLEGLDLLRKSLGAFPHALFLVWRAFRPQARLPDVVVGVRSLRSRPGLTVVALATLALGIGANVFVFSLVQNVLLHPFPYRDIDRLVAVEAVFPRVSAEGRFLEAFSMNDVARLEEAGAFSSLLVFDLGNRDLGGVGEPQRLRTAAIAGDAFETLGMKPALGRGFTREEIERSEPVAILSDRVFQRFFGGDESLLGETIVVNGNPRTLVGILPPRLLLLDTDLWLPMWYSRTEVGSRRVVAVLGRLSDDTSLEQARRELDIVARRIEADASKTAKEYSGFRLVPRRFLDVWAGYVGPGGYVLWGAAGITLLVACGNLAGLLLARGSARRHEIAVRAAMGAGRGRLVTQLLVESGLLSVAGGALGLLLTHFALQVVSSRLPATLPLSGIELGIDATVLGYAVAVSLLSALLFGVAPAREAAKVNVASILSLGAGRASAGRRSLRLRRVFVTLQIALSLVLLTGAGLLTESFERLGRVEPGFPVDHLLTLRVTLPWERHAGKLERFYRRWLAGLESRVGTRNSALATQFPPELFLEDPILLENAERDPEETLPKAYHTVVSPGFFDTLGMTLVRGRSLSASDSAEAPPVAVVNEAFGRRYFEGREPLGKRIRVGREPEKLPWTTIVGVFADTKNRGLDREPAPEIWSSYEQRGAFTNQIFLLVRTEGEPRGVLPTIRETLRSLDPDLPVYQVQTLEERFAAASSNLRLASVSMTSLAAGALVLAAMGLYGVIAFVVGERRREIGIRIALGADSHRVLGHVLGEAAVLVLVGLALGVTGSLALGRLLSALLFETEPHDPVMLLTASMVLAIAALLAAYVPARRASSVDPAASFR